MHYFKPWLSFFAVLSVSIFECTGQAADSKWVAPHLNTESIVSLGKTMLHEGTIYERAAIHLSEEITFGKDKAYALTPGYYVRSGERIGWETYVPADGPEAGGVKKADGVVTLQGSFHYSNDDKTIGVITNFYQAMNADAKGITRTTQPAFSSEKIQRSLVYGGKSGTNIKLAYRELWKNITRPAGDKWIEYDLSESKVVECKGARIEIIEATHKQIRYRVTRSFGSTDN